MKVLVSIGCVCLAFGLLIYNYVPDLIKPKLVQANAPTEDYSYYDTMLRKLQDTKTVSYEDFLADETQLAAVRNNSVFRNDYYVLTEEYKKEQEQKEKEMQKQMLLSPNQTVFNPPITNSTDKTINLTTSALSDKELYEQILNNKVKDRKDLIVKKPESDKSKEQPKKTSGDEIISEIPAP